MSQTEILCGAKRKITLNIEPSGVYLKGGFVGKDNCIGRILRCRRCGPGRTCDLSSETLNHPEPQR